MAKDDSKGGDYEVGYGKPPVHTRFRPGQSGNPKGPKKGSRSLKTDLEDALRAPHTITVAGRKHKGTTQALAMRTLAMRAASGDLRAQRLLTDLVLQVFGAGDRSGEEARLSAQDQMLLDRMLGRYSEGPGEQEETPASGEACDPDDSAAVTPAKSDGEATDG